MNEKLVKYLFNKETKGKDVLYTTRNKSNQWLDWCPAHFLQ